METLFHILVGFFLLTVCAAALMLSVAVWWLMYLVSCDGARAVLKRLRGR